MEILPAIVWEWPDNMQDHMCTDFDYVLVTLLLRWFCPPLCLLEESEPGASCGDQAK